PQNFSLLASDRRRVKVLARWAKAGQIATTIDIVGHQVSSSTFPALAGIKLPLTMKISSGEMTYTWAWWLLGGSLLILLGLGGWQVRKWRHHRRWWQKALAKMDLLHHKKFF
ncbi:MAG: hypothetical protein NTV81_04660, partial [Candidatus Komeilibacteria bacterium]|nr:hypothetical protein [Candidatus Komeilibacteria bacterium]